MKFTLRDLFWLTLVVALATGWALHARQWQAERQSLILELVEKLDATTKITRGSGGIRLYTDQ
jgi:hypothetical protein